MQLHGDDALASLLRELFAGLDERSRLPEGPERKVLDVRLGSLLDRLRRVWHSPRAATLYGEEPPRPVAVAFALAVMSQPHLAATLDVTGDPLADARRPDPPLAATQEALAKVVGLPAWELEDMRDEVDQRAVRTLKQQSAAEWLVGYFAGKPDPDDAMWRVLFPGVEAEPGSVRFVRRGPSLYALLEQPPITPAALYMGWLGERVPGRVPAVGGFQARYVEPGLRRALARGTGSSLDEVDLMLERMVCALPAEHWETHARHDSWRATGAASLTQLSPSYAESAWLSRPLRASDVHVRSFIDPARPDDDVIISAFDAMAGRRAAAAVRQIQAELIARLYSAPDLSAPSGVDDIELFDEHFHIGRALEALHDWAVAPATSAFVAATLDCPPELASRAMEVVGERWRERSDERWRPSPSQDASSVQAAVVMHLVALHASLRQLLVRPAQRLGPQRDVLLLYAAHSLGSTPIETLWTSTSDSLSPREDPWGDVVGPWFWALWKALEARLADL